MSQKMLLGELSHSFVSLGTLRRMSHVATKMAVARKAIEGIRDIEDALVTSGDDARLLRQGMSETASLARLAGRSAAEAIGILRQMVPDIEAYLVEVERDAAS